MVVSQTVFVKIQTNKGLLFKKTKKQIDQKHSESFVKPPLLACDKMAIFERKYIKDKSLKLRKTLFMSA